MRVDRIGAARQCVVVPIRAPLPHVAVHVEQAPRIGLLQANRVGVLLTSGVASKPRVLAQLLFIVSKGKRRLRPGTARVLPLGVCR